MGLTDFALQGNWIARSQESTLPGFKLCACGRCPGSDSGVTTEREGTFCFKKKTMASPQGVSSAAKATGCIQQKTLENP